MAIGPKSARGLKSSRISVLGKLSRSLVRFSLSCKAKHHVSVLNERL
jgi:hypothetical protein